jgi:sugar phosphate isomerase/epimerase
MGSGLMGKVSAVADSLPKPITSGPLKVSINAYSFSKMLNDNIKHRGPGITLIQALEFAAKCKSDGFDATGYFMPNYPDRPTDAYVKELKTRAADLGVGISGTGVRNNFTTSDKEVRAKGVQHIKEFVEVAAQLGAPVVRVFSDTQMKAKTWHDVAPGATYQQVQDWIAENLRECADHAKKYNVRIGVQNHGDFLQTGEQHLALMKAVNSDACGPIVDTGYYKTKDPYNDIAMVAPFSVNWQIKQSPFGEDSEIPTDLVKVLHIVRESGYHGYLPIETLSPAGKPYDPFTVVPAFLQQLREAIVKTA